MKAGHNNPPPVDGSFIIYHREWLEHPLVGRSNPEYNCWWTDLLCYCNYQNGSIFVNGFKFDLRPGEMVGAVSFLANRWNVGPRRVRTFLDHAVSFRLITLHKRDKQSDKQKGKQPHLISIIHYNELGVSDALRGQTNRQAIRTASDKQPTSNRQEPNKETNKQNTLSKRARAKAPHMNGVGFVLSEAWDISIPHEVIERWRTSYTNFPDLDAQLTSMAVNFMGSSTAVQRFREYPEHWFEPILAKENAKLAGKGDEKQDRLARWSRKLETIARKEDAKR